MYHMSRSILAQCHISLATQPMLLSDDDDEGSGSIYSSDNEP